MTAHTRRATIATATLLAALATSSAAQQATPQINAIEETSTPGEPPSWYMVAPLPGANSQVGLFVTCSNTVEVTVFLGSFPPAGTPVQLAPNRNREVRAAIRRCGA